MLHCLPKNTKTTLFQAPEQLLAMRIETSSNQKWIVELSEQKCTIGSSVDCTISLQEEGVRPVHAILFRNGNRTVVQRWAEDCWLNGRPFETEILQPGDCLTLGSVELEVLSKSNEDSTDIAKTDTAETSVTASTPVVEVVEKVHVDESRPVKKSGKKGCRTDGLFARLSQTHSVPNAPKTSLPKIAPVVSKPLLEQPVIKIDRKHWQERAHKLIQSIRQARQVASQNTDSLQELKARYEQLQQALQKREDQLHAEQLRTVSCKNNSADVHNELRNEILKLQTEEESHRSEIVSLQQKLNDQTEELAAYQSLLEQAQEALQESNQKTEPSDDTTSELELHNIELSEQLAKQKEAHENLVEKLSETEEAYSKFLNEHEKNDGKEANWDIEKQSWISKRNSWKNDRNDWAVDRESWNSDRKAWQVDHDTWGTERKSWSTEREAWLTEQEGWASKVQKLEFKIASSFAERESLFGKIEALSELEQTNANQAELVATIEKLERELSQWAEEQTRWDTERSEWDAKQEQLQAERDQALRNAEFAATNQAESEVWAMEREELESNNASMAAKLNEQTELLEESRLELANASEAINESKKHEAQHQEEIAELRNTLSEVSAERDSTTADPIDANEALDQEREVFESSSYASSNSPEWSNFNEPLSNRSEESEIKEAELNEPTELINPLAEEFPESAISRLKDLGIWNSKSSGNDTSIDTDIEEEPASYSNTVEQVAGPAVVDTPPASEDHDSEEALKAYMSRLMERVRGENPNAPLEEQGQSFTDTFLNEDGESVCVEDETPNSLPVEKAPQPVAMLKNIKSIKREGSLPQRTGNYEALRELANSSTRQAISTHHDKVSRDHVWSKFLVAAVGIITGMQLIYWAGKGETLHFWTGWTCIALGSYWVLGAIRIVIKSAKSGSPNKMPSKKSQSQPTDHDLQECHQSPASDNQVQHNQEL